MIARISPSQDTFIFGPVRNGTALSGSAGDTRCAGKDEILELGRSSYSTAANPFSSRMLVQFDSASIQNVLINVPSGCATTATLRYYLADAEGLPETYRVNCYSVPEPWLEGTARSYDSIVEVDGATWKFRAAGQEWETVGAITSASYISSTEIKTKPVRQDLQIGAADALSSEYGIALALNNEEELVEQGASLKYFSSNTHTIYKPYLQIEWDDSVFDTEFSEIRSSDFIVSSNTKPEYRLGDLVPINLSVVPLYPERIFTTSSIYKVEYVLPEESYWGIKDEYTNEMVVDFSTGTKISAGDSGSYFRLDTSILEPERYYRLLIQVRYSRNRVTVDSKDIFKVVRNGKQ